MHLVLMIILCASTTVVAQDNTALFSRIENAIRQKAPNWKLEKMQISKNGKYVYYRWKSGKSAVTILMLVHTSSQEVAKNFNALADDLEINGLKMRRLGSSLQNLGDENYLWEGFRAQRVFGVDFRKGRIVVHTNAPSIAVAEQFALQIAEGIPSS